MVPPWVAAIFFCLVFHASARPPTEGEKRVAETRKRLDASVREAVEKAGLQYPPREIFIRIFKFESILEVWARNEQVAPFKFVFEFPLDSQRGRGRKKREGDRTTPEGCYRVIDFNPESAAYLSLRLDYPNAADRLHAGSDDPGSLIFIHGAGYSTGCVPVTYPGMGQLYLLALDTKRRPIQVHIFPHQLDRPDEEVDSDALIAINSALGPFWEELRPIYDAFERTKRVPKVIINKRGHYAVVPEPTKRTKNQ